jgi:GT2 family glycosyltransferase
MSEAVRVERLERAGSRLRVVVDGKFFRLGEKKFYVKGLTYGPFAPNAQGEHFPSPDQTARDFRQIRESNANVIRVYHVPPRWLLALAQEYDLKILVDIPWNKHLCFLDSLRQRQEAREAVYRAVLGCAGHPAVFAFSVANEISPDIVRWSGTEAVADFIDELVAEAKRADPECLCTYTNFPPTEFLRPQSLDFICFNVYLHNPQPFRNYLARLQMIADSRPLMLGEFGIDSLREGEARKCEMLAWQIESTFRGGLAGAVVFSFTDEWYKEGRIVADWKMGLTTAARDPKESFRVVQELFGAAPYFPLPGAPKVSVVVASYNGERTLKLCLESLRRLNYPDYEVILVDDGSTDTTPQTARSYPEVRYFRHAKNLGLSAARNTGIAAADGEIIAFTDSDCRADEDWLYYLVGGLLNSEFAGIGGPNLLPPEDSRVAATVMVSPGGPAHVMLTDRQAEHIPGCNMAFYKWAFAEVGGFDPVFTKAGDDVDICWRLQQGGYKIGFSPAAFVWHYRRSTVAAYLRQQHGYGESEALLVRKHPEYFNSFGGSIWRGRIYTASKFGVMLRPSIIYRGLFGSAGFQTMYQAAPAISLMLCTSLEYHVTVTLPLWILSATFHYLLPLATTSLLISLGVCVAAAAQAALPKNKMRWWSRPLVALLFFLQPIVRGWARYQNRLTLRPLTAGAEESLDSVALRENKQALHEICYWTSKRIERLALVSRIIQQLDEKGWPNKSDIGWSEYDVEIHGSRWCHLQLTTVTEDYAEEKQAVRCRLNTRWSLQAKIALWVMIGFELLIIGVAGRSRPWLWVLLLTVPLFVWFMVREQRKLQSLVAVFLDQIAKEWSLVKVRMKNAEVPKQGAPAAEESSKLKAQSSREVQSSKV